MRNPTILRLLGLPFASVTLFFFALATPSAAFADETQSPTFSRYTEDLPMLLEKDAVTVMARGFTYEIASKLCWRVGAAAYDVESEAVIWRFRNDAFIKAAAQAINEIGNQHIPLGGEQAKQAYLQMVARGSSEVVNQRITSQFNGENLDNNIIPPEPVCVQLANLLRSGKVDFQSTPEVTSALRSYMQRKKKP